DFKASRNIFDKILGNGQGLFQLVADKFDMRHCSLQKIRSTEGSRVSLRNLGRALRGGMNYLQSFRVEIPILSVRLQLLYELEESPSCFLGETACVELVV